MTCLEMLNRMLNNIALSSIRKFIYSHYPCKNSCSVKHANQLVIVTRKCLKSRVLNN